MEQLWKNQFSSIISISFVSISSYNFHLFNSLAIYCCNVTTIENISNLSLSIILNVFFTYKDFCHKNWLFFFSFFSRTIEVIIIRKIWEKLVSSSISIMFKCVVKNRMTFFFTYNRLSILVSEIFANNYFIFTYFIFY